MPPKAASSRFANAAKQFQRPAATPAAPSPGQRMTNLVNKLVTRPGVQPVKDDPLKDSKKDAPAAPPPVPAPVAATPAPSAPTPVPAPTVPPAEPKADAKPPAAAATDSQPVKDQPISDSKTDATTTTPAPPAAVGVVPAAAAAPNPLWETLKSLAKELLGADRFMVACAVLAVAATLTAMIMSIVFAVRANSEYAATSDNPSLLNIESLDFTGISATSWKTRYPYWVFLLLNGVAMAAVVAGFARGLLWPIATPMVMWVLLVGLGLYCAAVLACMIALFVTTHRSLRTVRGRVRGFNAYVCSRILKNAKFLEPLTKVPTDVVAGYDAIRQAMAALAEDDKVTEDMWARALYTASLYQYFVAMGARHPMAADMLDVFQPTRLIVNQCNPADYLLYDGLFIDDQTSILQNRLPTSVRESDTFGEMLSRVSEWIIETNNLGNTIEPEKALRPFLFLTRWTAIVQNATAGLVALALFKDKWRDALTKFVMK